MKAADYHAYCTACGATLPEMEEKQDSIDNLLRDNSRLKGRVRKLLNEIDAIQCESKYESLAQEIYDYWRSTVAPRAREFSVERRKAVVARLNAASGEAEAREIFEFIKRAIDGAALRPFINAKGHRVASGKPDQQWTDLELICRTEAKVTAFAAIADAAPQHDADLLSEWRAARTRLTPAVCDRLQALRGWSPATITALGLGIEGNRVVFPIVDCDAALVGLVKYAPNPNRQTKSIAAGDRGLFPRPERMKRSTIWLVEGEPDAMLLLSLQMAAVAIPGVKGWRPEWVDRFSRFVRVIICFDCDVQGRDAARARQQNLAPVVHTTIVDLDPGRTDGFDVTDYARENGTRTVSMLNALAEPTRKLTLVSSSGSPLEKMLAGLRARDSKITRTSKGYECTCPAHDDQHASLSIGEGADERLIIHCHAGCQSLAVLQAVGMSWRDAFLEEAS